MVVANHLPARAVDLDAVLLLAIATLDPVVDEDYVLCYVHTGFVFFDCILLLLLNVFECFDCF